jgi:hypothetical protein
LDDTLPHFMGVQWDSVQATHGVSAEAYMWKTALGEVGPGAAFWSCHELLRVSCCQVYTLTGLTIDSNLRNTIEHG